MIAAGAPDVAGALADHVARRRAMFYPKSDIAVDDAALRALARHGADEGLADARAALGAALGPQAAARCTLEALAQQGTYHRVWRATDPSSGSRYVVRLNRLAAQETDWQLRADESVSKALTTHGIPHARVLRVDCSRAAASTDFEVAEFIDGVSLSTRDARDEEIVPLLPRVAAALKGIHAIRGEGFGFLDVARAPALVGVHRSWPAFLGVQLRENLDQVGAASLLDPAERQAAERHFAAGLAAVAGATSQLLHGDTGNHNILERADGTLVFIDWEDAVLGDPVFDVAFWATFHPERRWSAFFDAYFAPGWKPDARFWLYFLRVAISKTVHRLRFGYADRPDRPKASLRMQRALQGLADCGGFA